MLALVRLLDILGPRSHPGMGGGTVCCRRIPDGCTGFAYDSGVSRGNTTSLAFRATLPVGASAASLATVTGTDRALPSSGPICRSAARSPHTTRPRHRGRPALFIRYNAETSRTANRHCAATTSQNALRSSPSPSSSSPAHHPRNGSVDEMADERCKQPICRDTHPVWRGVVDDHASRPRS